MSLGAQRPSMLNAPGARVTGDDEPLDVGIGN